MASRLYPPPSAGYAQALFGPRVPRQSLFGSGPSLYGDGSYSGNIIQGGVTLQPQVYNLAGVGVLENCIVVTGAATIAPNAETSASVAMGHNLVVIGPSATLAPSTNSKGLGLLFNGAIHARDGGRILVDKLGKAGNFGDLTAYDLLPAVLKAKVSHAKHLAYVILGEGALGAAGVYGIDAPGVAGSAATAMQSGGGGSGNTNSSGGYNTGCGGGKGGPCIGGGGFSGDAGEVGSSAAPYGAGGNGSSQRTDNFPTAGGPGDPVGVGAGYAIINGVGAGGGLLMLFSPILSIASGCILSADGAAGSNANTYGAGTASGGAGGGVVCIVTDAGGYSNEGTVRASGGPAGLGWYNNAGAGGAGSVNILTAA